tara:strand:+ start:45 stop:566 length:522 start_codon:yes stop_codon:yes gene_type:complete
MSLTFHANGKIDGINNANFNSSLPTGHVIQVQYVESDTIMSNQSSSSLVDITGLSVSITPQSSSSKLFIIMNLNLLTIEGGSSGTDAAIGLAIVKDGSVIQTGEQRFKCYHSGYRGTFEKTLQTVVTAGTTNAITIKGQVRKVTGSNIFEVNPSSGNSNDQDHCCITVMEIAP